MKKRAYRATEVKKLDSEDLKKKYSNDRIIFGVDAARTDFYCNIMDINRESLLTVKWIHPLETEQFISLVCQFSKAEVVLEPSGTYGDPLRYQLEKFNIPVFRVSPKRSHDAAEVYDGVPSLHDAKSAAIISRLHLDGASEKWELKGDHERDLAAVLTSLDTLNQQYIQNTNRLEAQMAKHWPEIGEFVKYGQVTFLELLRQIGGPFQVASNEKEAYALMKKIGGNFFSSAKIEKIIHCSEKTIGLPMTEGELIEIKKHAARTLELHREIKALKKKVEHLSQENEAVRNISEVVGKSTSAVIVTFCGDPLKYDSSRHWLKSFGLNLKEKSSGKHKGRLMITRRGSGRSRRWLYFAVLRLIQKDEIVRAWYQRKVMRDGGVKMKAIIGIMRKLAKALWYVARGEKFDTTKLFDRKHLGLSV